MKRSIFTILCAALVLCALAETPRLSHAQLQRASMSKCRTVVPLSPAAGKEKPVTLQQVLKERNLTFNDNRLISRTPLRQSPEDLAGSRIASMDVYDFEWDEENGIAIVIDSTYALAGKYCKFNVSYYEDGIYMSITGLFDWENSGNVDDPYCIPLDYDGYSDIVKLKTGTMLASKYYETSDPGDPGILPRSSLYEVTCKLYAMPLTWLTGDDEYGDIFGQVCEDGTIVFYDDFAFLVEKEYYYGGEFLKTTWGLSPIYKNLTLLNPNGTHSYNCQTVTLQKVAGECGSGGLSPRPINPRPGNTKPVKPRAFSTDIDVNANGDKMALSTDGDTRSSLTNGFNSQPEEHLSEVYIYQLDDTTLMVYNLYDMDYCWNYMNIYPDGTVSFPGQEIGMNSGLHFNVLYNYSRALSQHGPYNDDDYDYSPGNHGTWSQSDSVYTVEWNATCLRASGELKMLLCLSNQLCLYDSLSYLVPYTVFAEPVVTDSAVVFTARSMAPGGVVHMVAGYGGVDNPWIAPRGDEPYWVQLFSQSYLEETDTWGPWVSLLFEVPALEHPFILGDVNGDGVVSIRDVTELIGCLLSGDETAINIDQADVNRSGSLNITDVTILINFMLSNQWPDSDR